MEVVDNSTEMRMPQCKEQLEKEAFFCPICGKIETTRIASFEKRHGDMGDSIVIQFECMVCADMLGFDIIVPWVEPWISAFKELTTD